MSMPKAVKNFMEDNNIKPYQKFGVTNWPTKFWFNDEGELWNEHNMSQDIGEQVLYKLLTEKIKVLLVVIPKGTRYYYYDTEEDKIKSPIFYNSDFDRMAILARNFFLTYAECEAAQNQIKANLIKAGSEIHDRL